MNAEGMPMRVTIQPTRSSMARERGLMLSEPSVMMLVDEAQQALLDCESSTISRR